MKGPSPKTAIAVLSFIAVVSVAVVDFDRTAPGALIAAHARIDGLSSESNCADCHGGWTSSMTESCLECHVVIRDHINGNHGLHGAIDEAVAANCAGCHSDHHGANFQAVNDLSFARAGVADRALFEHRTVDFDMGGAHLELACTECHEHAEAVIVPEGAHRYVGLVQSCAACHEDPHGGALSTSCFVCHTQNAFDEHVMIGHASFLPLEGAHGALDCRACHAAGDSHSLEVLRGPQGARPAARDCRACHEQPHTESFIQESAVLAGVLRPLSLAGAAANALCSHCHGPEHLSFQESAADLTPTEHLASGFPLAEPHDAVECADCHAPAAPWAERYPGRGADDCAACHADPHAGQFAGLVFDVVADAFAGGSVDAKGCLVCHARTHFEPHGFGLEAHAATDLALEGAHAAADCNACHDFDPAGVRVFHGLDHACDACHEDAHLGFFAPFLAAAPEPAPEHGDCARCHDAAAFASAGTDAFDHGAWTGYALTGSHAVAACTSCHPRADGPDATGRTFGRVSTVWGEVSGCVTCHVDVHEGLFDEAAHLAVVDGRRDCARCHSEASFRDLPHGFDHGRWTGWKLDGAHAAASCTACHAPLRRPDEAGRTWGHAAGRDCASCHESPHGTQFAASADFRAKTCEKCHTSAESFSALRFDHDLESRFPLDEAHESVACASCHVPPADGGPVTYRPLSRECVDCHGVHEKALRKRQKRR